MMRWQRGLALVAAFLLLAGCGSGVGPAGDLVGGPCAGERDCARGSLCLLDDDFPGGTCALPCAVQRNCPSGSSCVRKEDNVCLLSCRYNDECRPQYRCRGVERAERDGDALVCIE